MASALAATSPGKWSGLTASTSIALVLRSTVIGYRALAVDFSENGRFGKNGVDDVQHGPVMGVRFRW